MKCAHQNSFVMDDIPIFRCICGFSGQLNAVCHTLIVLLDGKHSALSFPQHTRLSLRICWFYKSVSFTSFLSSFSSSFVNIVINKQQFAAVVSFSSVFPNNLQLLSPSLQCFQTICSCCPLLFSVSKQSFRHFLGCYWRSLCPSQGCRCPQSTTQGKET